MAFLKKRHASLEVMRKHTAAGYPVMGIGPDVSHFRSAGEVVLIESPLGSEYQTLLGAKEILRKTQPAIFLTLNETALRAHGSSSAQIKDMLLAEYGYRGWLVNGEPITDDMVLAGSECIFVAGAMAEFPHTSPAFSD